jgi:hypothetical protein
MSTSPEVKDLEKAVGSVVDTAEQQRIKEEVEKETARLYEDK